MIAGLLFFVFIAIFLCFNISVNRFIGTDATAQLNDFTNLYNADKDQGGSLPDMSKQPKNRTGTKAELFALGETYTVENVYGDDEGVAQDAQQIAAGLKEKQWSLNNLTNQRLKTPLGQYYLTAIQNERQPDSFLIFYVDITSISRFAGMINRILLLVMASAAFVSSSLRRCFQNP